MFAVPWLQLNKLWDMAKNVQVILNKIDALSCQLDQNAIRNCSLDFIMFWIHLFVVNVHSWNKNCSKQWNEANNQLLHFGLNDKNMHFSHSNEPVPSVRNAKYSGSDIFLSLKGGIMNLNQNLVSTA